jgi:hypothetical protein
MAAVAIPLQHLRRSARQAAELSPARCQPLVALDEPMINFPFIPRSQISDRFALMFE